VIHSWRCVGTTPILDAIQILLERDGLLTVRDVAQFLQITQPMSARCSPPGGSRVIWPRALAASIHPTWSSISRGAPELIFTKCQAPARIPDELYAELEKQEERLNENQSSREADTSRIQPSQPGQL
jgi:hypothetical protein